MGQPTGNINNQQKFVKPTKICWTNKNDVDLTISFSECHMCNISNMCNMSNICNMSIMRNMCNMRPCIVFERQLNVAKISWKKLMTNEHFDHNVINYRLLAYCHWMSNQFEQPKNSVGSTNLQYQQPTKICCINKNFVDSTKLFSECNMCDMSIMCDMCNMCVICAISIKIWIMMW